MDHSSFFASPKRISGVRIVVKQVVIQRRQCPQRCPRVRLGRYRDYHHLFDVCLYSIDCSGGLVSERSQDVSGDFQDWSSISPRSDQSYCSGGRLCDTSLSHSKIRHRTIGS